jgi:hypothetical protein
LGDSLAGSTTKKVLIRRFDREPLSGFVNPQVYLRQTGIELMSQAGDVTVVPYYEVKTVCFVKDFDAEPDETRKVFQNRPKTDGLWVRATFRDNEIMEGILNNNLLQLEPFGFTVVPPDPNSNNQRIFVPRAALKEIQVLGVVGSPLRRRKPKPPSKDQISLFDQ